MIEAATVNGRPAVVAYLGGMFGEATVEPDEAVLIKVTFTDDEGGIAFLVGPKGTTETPAS